MRVLFLFLLLFSSLYAEKRILALAGSTRLGSYNKQLASDAAEVAECHGAKVVLIDLKDFPMPFYDEDLEREQGTPENASRFRALINESDALIIASPEYNLSFSAVLKNALDWASRTEGDEHMRDRELFENKKIALMCASVSRRGGIEGLISLKKVIENMGGTVIDELLTIPLAHKAFDCSGHLKSREQQGRLEKVICQLLE